MADRSLVDGAGTNVTEDAGATGHIDNVTAHGLADPTAYSIVYSAVTRQFTITSTTDVAVNGVNSSASSETTAAHADVTGQYWVYYASGSTTATVATSADICTNAIVGRVYYNTDQASAKAIEFEERHSQEFTARLHENMHETVGAKLVTSPLGCSLSDYILEDSTNDDSVNFSVSSGGMYDEDIEKLIDSLASGTYTIAYRAGLDSVNRLDWDDAATNPFKTTGTYLDYNELSGGTWGQTELANNTYVNMFVFSWTRKNTRQNVIFQGQNTYLSLSGAQVEEPGDLSLPSAIAPEQVPLFRVTFRCRSTYTGTTGDCRIEAVTDYRGMPGAQVVGGSSTDHQTLINRTAIGSHPASAIEPDASTWVDTNKPLSITDTDLQTVNQTLNDWIPTKDSSTLLTGFVITDAGAGKVDVASGTAQMKTTDSDLSMPVAVTYAGDTDVELTDDMMNYIYFNYNGGSPIIAVTTDISTVTLTDQIPVGTVYRHNSTVHISNVPLNLANYDAKSAFRLFEKYGRDRIYGMITTETGDRKLAITAGVLYFAFWRFTTAALDTSGSDTFNYFYNDGDWQQATSSTTIDNLQYNDYGTGLATLASQQYGVHWAYLSNGGTLHVVYGQGSYTESEAREAEIPSNMPAEVIQTGILIAKIIVKKSETNLFTIIYPWETLITGSVASEHNGLGGLQGGTAEEYYHLTAAEYAALGGGGAGLAKNAIIGGDFMTNPWQRGVSFTAPSTLDITADMWRFYNYSAVAVADVIKTADAPTAAESTTYTTQCLHVDMTTADASLLAGEAMFVEQRMEGLNTARFGFGKAGTRNVTLSFWHKHTKTGVYCISLLNSAQDRSYVSEYTQSTTNAWEKAEITIPVDTSTTWLYDTGIGLRVNFTVGAGTSLQATADNWTTGAYYATSNQVNGLDNTANNFKIALVQLESGSIATDFETLDAGTVLSKCQRYYFQNDGSVGGKQWIMRPITTVTSGNTFEWFSFPAVMRTVPTVGFNNTTFNNGNTPVLAGTNNDGVEAQYTITGATSFMQFGITASSDL